ncbi:hypothetical protein AB0383_48645 [Amycolatopsis sp. NPDC051373]|uniref:hypothetical protein n=1 Tax=Amycolatopsis sp. NPDC051373 TaxID=3155801 RepID=UPI00344D2B3A
MATVFEKVAGRIDEIKRVKREIVSVDCHAHGDVEYAHLFNVAELAFAAEIMSKPDTDPAVRCIRHMLDHSKLVPVEFKVY